MIAAQGIAAQEEAGPRFSGLIRDCIVYPLLCISFIVIIVVVYFFLCSLAKLFLSQLASCTFCFLILLLIPFGWGEG